jgi:hypothetical protein
MLLSNWEPLMLHSTKAENRRLVSLCFFVSIVVAAGLLFGCAGEPKHPTWKNATGAEQHERLMWQAVRDKDWASLERHLSPTFTGVTADGRLVDRAGWLERWKSSEMREFSLGEVQTQPEGIDMKVTYIFRGQASAKALLPASGLRVVSVWQDVSGRWMLSAISMTPIQTQ